MHWPIVNWVIPGTQQWIQLVALGTALLSLALMTLELRSTVRLRGLVTRDMQRIFEQLDLARLDVLRLDRSELVPAQSAPRRRESPSPMPARRAALATATEEDRYQLAQQLAHDGNEAREISDRCGLSIGEARMIIGVHGAISTMTGSHTQ